MVSHSKSQIICLNGYIKIKISMRLINKYFRRFLLKKKNIDKVPKN